MPTMTLPPMTGAEPFAAADRMVGRRPRNRPLLMVREIHWTRLPDGRCVGEAYAEELGSDSFARYGSPALKPWLDTLTSAYPLGDFDWTDDEEPARAP